MTDLPVLDVIPALREVLASGNNAVLVAPPGAGKTTAVAPALLGEGWCSGQILLLSPRRLAARAAAERMADLSGQAVGRTIGYATRMDSKQSRDTRILVLTEGIFRSRIISDPELTGISAVLFDEVHERSLDSDFGLALALEAQAAFRPHLRLIAMSATLDGARFSALMHDAPVIESKGRSFPLVHRYLGRKAEQPIEDAMTAAIRTALVEEPVGDILAFLPGAREIERTAERLGGRLGDVRVLPLHGTLRPEEQRAAIRPDANGTRKVILATSIAETSLTIDGVRIVVDSGLARRPRFDVAAGIGRLVTERASQAAVVQRAGRAARQGPGVAYRLWEEAATAGLPPYDPPEIMESDLAPLMLDCASWGENDPARLAWLDPPPHAALKEARVRLEAIGALAANGAITPHGVLLARLPLSPALAHMLAIAGEHGQARVAAEIALLLQERGLGGRDIDLDRRLSRWRGEKNNRAESARRLAERWAALVPGDSDITGELSVGAMVALAFPHMVARRRSGDGADWLSVGGRGYRLDTASPLARADWLAIADAQGVASGARILVAAALDETELTRLFADRIEQRRTVRYDPGADRIEAVQERRLGALRLSGGADDSPDPGAVSAALLEGVCKAGLALLPWPDAATTLRDRVLFAGTDILSDKALSDGLEDWLEPLLAGKRRLRDVDGGGLLHALEMQLGWDEKQRIDRLAPTHFTSPAGTRHAIDYAAPGGPAVELRVQALFGLAGHPCVGNEHIPLVLSLTSPAGRPIQTTRDLPGFWTGSWRDVVKDMRGRYPRHHWPDDPTQAAASLKTKKKQGL